MDENDLRRFRTAIYAFLFVVSVSVMSGLELRPSHANESTVVDPNQLAFAIETVDKQGIGIWTTSIAFDSNNRPNICYFKGALRYARYDGSSWIFETVDSNVGYIKECSLDLDDKYYPHISYATGHPSDAAGLSPIFLKYAYFNGTSWVFQNVDEGEIYRPSSALDSLGNPHISYLDAISRTVKYAHYNGSSWLIQSVDSYGYCAYTQSIALDSHDRPHIAYYQDSHGNPPQYLKYAYYNGTSWSIETVDGKNTGYLSIALDSQNHPHISYGNLLGGLKNAYFDGASWKIQIVPSTEQDYVCDNSIALDSEDNPHISYLKLTESYSDRSLRYAYYNGVSWSVKTVDNKANVGFGNSIAVDSRGYPYISYVYLGSGGAVYAAEIELRYARGGVRPAASFTYLPSKPIVSEIVTFDASTSYDPDGTIVSYAWDFGDGTNITETDPVAAHAYATAGNYTVVLTVADDDRFNAVTTQFIAITKLNSTISISLSSSTSYIGFKVEINGNLTYNKVGLSGTPILLSYSVTGGETWNDITLANTISDGGYSAVWMPSATGNYLVRAIWTGNVTYSGANATVSLAVIPFKEQNVFSVTSNSSVSELVFNSTSRELSFTVTGTSGTTGYVNVYVAKTLIGNIADVKVYLDGAQLNYTITSMDDSWLLHFTYLHSTHKVTISLGNISPPFIETILGNAVIFGAPIAAVSILIIFFKRRQIINRLRRPMQTIN